MNHAAFPPLPPFRTDVKNPLDEVFSTTIIGRFPVRQINERYWKGFDILLSPGSRVLIREDIDHGYRFSYQLIATEDCFRRIIYICQLNEIGPDHDITREQYFEKFTATV